MRLTSTSATCRLRGTGLAFSVSEGLCAYSILLPSSAIGNDKTMTALIAFDSTILVANKVTAIAGSIIRKIFRASTQQSHGLRVHDKKVIVSPVTSRGAIAA